MLNVHDFIDMVYTCFQYVNKVNESAKTAREIVTTVDRLDAKATALHRFWYRGGRFPLLSRDEQPSQECIDEHPPSSSSYFSPSLFITENETA